MTWRLRRSKRLGPIRLTVSRRGLSTSVGFGDMRISCGADGKVRRTVRIPRTGPYNVDVIGRWRGPTRRRR
jgi:Protein of unknown function (DUF4236)